MRTAWNRLRDAIIPHYIAQRPGSRPFACYMFGEIPAPHLRHEVPEHVQGLEIGGTTWFPKWYYLGTATGHAGHYRAGTDYGEFRHLVDFGLLDRDEICRAEPDVDDREYEPARPCGTTKRSREVDHAKVPAGPITRTNDRTAGGTATFNRSPAAMAKIAEDFPLACPACGGDIRLIAFITDPAPIRKILLHLGEPLEPPPLAPARGPPTSWSELMQVHDDRDVIQASPDDLPAIDIRTL